MLWMVQRVFFGPIVQTDNETLRDLNLREMATVLPFIVLVIWMGVMPQPFLDRLAQSTDRLVRRAEVGRGKSTDNLLIQAASAPPPTVQGIAEAP
jgi:NADH-quinone oxidoreductase subunit M